MGCQSSAFGPGTEVLKSDKLYLFVEHLDALDAEETAGKSRQTACPLGVGIDRGSIRCKKGLGL